MKYLLCGDKKEVNLKYDMLIVILGIGGFISAADNWFVSPILPAIASEFNASIPRVGIILTLYMIPYGIMQPVYGYLSDCRSKVKILKLIICGFACLGAGSIIEELNAKIGCKNVIILGEIFALMTTLFLEVFHCWQMGLAATISLGIGYIFVQSTLATMAFDVAPDAKGLPSGLIGFGLFCGGGLGSAFSGFIIAKINYQLLWILFFIFITHKISFSNE